jgi:hypothetical protein
MDKLPFSVYDFFACLSAGFLVIAAADYALNHGRLLTRGHALFLDLGFVIAAYVAGHVVAELASLLYERRLVARRLGYPTDILLGRSSSSSAWRRVVPSYFAALPAATQARVKARAESRDFAAAGQALFYHCHAIVKRDPVVLARLSTFLNLYGFARNNSLASLLAAPILVVGAIFTSGHEGAKVALAVTALCVAAVLFIRYLKFFRLYTVEVLVSYAETAP